MIANRNTPSKIVWRAQSILATSQGCGTSEIMRRWGKSKTCVWRWQERFMKEGWTGRHDGNDLAVAVEEDGGTSCYCPPGGEHATSYGNAGCLSSHSVIPSAEPGMWKKVPSFLLDPLGPLSIRWSYLPKVMPWLIRFLLAARTPALIEETAKAMRTLLVDAPKLHAGLAAEAAVSHLIERRGVPHVYPDRSNFEAEARSWAIHRKVRMYCRGAHPLLHDGRDHSPITQS